MDVFNLVAKITLDDSDYTATLKEAESNGKSFGTSFQNVIGGVSEALVAAGITATIKAIADQFARMINNTAQYADKVDKGSRQLSISADAYQEWDHALQQSGASIDVIRIGIGNLNEALTGVASDNVSKALEALKIDPAEYKSTEALLDSVLYTLADMESGAERDTLIDKIFGDRTGRMLKPLLDSGSKGIKDLQQEAHELGLVMSGEEITNGVAYGDAVANLNAALEGIKQQLVSGIIPLLTEAVKFATSIVAFFNGREAKGILGVITGIADEESEAVSQAEQDSTKAAGIVAYMDTLVEKYGEAASKTEEWATALKKLEEIYPGINQYIAEEGANLSTTTANLKEYIEKANERVKQEAKQRALQKYIDAYSQSEQDLTTAKIDKQIEQNKADEARKSLVDIIKQFEAGFTGNGQTIDQLVVAAQNYAGSDNELQEKIKALAKVYNDSTKAANDADAKIRELEQSTAMLKTAMDNAAAALANMEAAANSFQPYGEWANNYYGGNSHASGLNFVPYDDYVARLHRGEKVMTRTEADRYRAGIGSRGSYISNINLGGVTVANDIDIQSMAAKIAAVNRRAVRGFGG